MITEKQYLEALELIKNYRFQNKKKSGRKRTSFFTTKQKKEKTLIVFSFNKIQSYSEVLFNIQSVFKTGLSNSKKILNELQKEKLIKKNGNRGKYEIL